MPLIKCPPPSLRRWRQASFKSLSSLVRALARAYRWQKLIETGEFSSIAELAASERIDKSYVSKLLRLTLLAPDLVELILAGAKPDEIQIDALKQHFSPEWSKQRRLLLGSTGLAHVTAH